ncbi:hypothetical protein GQS65_10005 [Halomarina oriensis]|uniref:Uncharacterized protein n=2 Tax=Halomarina oriensis TaxID=671145 RepID=A0A6B0GLQ7_9EURY|nr:hypothetical protein [Halomarina oriensis]
MRLRITTTDSKGTPTTTRLGGVFEGERFDVRVFSTGTTEEVSDALGEHLLASDRYAVAPYDGDSEPTDATADADTEDN